MGNSALLVLEDGTKFQGVAIGAVGVAVGEVIFNTSITGYQEILTDPSYCNQIVAFTYPHIGNVGTNIHDQESNKIHVQGIIIRALSSISSNFRSEEDFSVYLQRNKIVGIAEIDTRKLTRLLRDKGTQKGCIISGKNIKISVALKKIRKFQGITGIDLAKKVSTLKTYLWKEGSLTLQGSLYNQSNKTNESILQVVVYDYGVKRNILRMLVDRGCRLTVVPAQTSAKEVLKLKPDGIFLSNGPGDPEPCNYAINAIQTFLKTKIPIFGICLGHQLLALASGAKTLKMKFGHHGANHPVKDLDENTVMITSQNHSFTVDKNSLISNKLRITHISLFDYTVQGIHRIDKPAFSFQGHPEASPGPHDAASPLFDHFIELMQIYRVKVK
ncbi:glutamine-hydrolyzing carbamoyl-phosphate synthase small subunit [Candidatus Pantoea carbekii]|uniref:Carbamoyl phosphate synthase small chain n=1 Tax=Candidatus Pantoea carbekii TaxID=1235990 RepID=U3U9G6_9GAMM|nr:glutamine-hydrolyzing carbamoyl-phosphate synthase small subunit [Candidatus Pantoea carbekii]AKC31951.1 carbamoyl-phosphate synthase, small subunit [Candidatus Pantoea carbekii]BAO00468.1 carbamoyl-phosphate synthase small chain [Candidatus Pantoea carbekii]